jgi:BirA family biotin operon repressor/biotin-[acetyl-CoA-carboxylase] ligase
MTTPREVWRPETRHVGRPVYFFDELPSTNDYARDLPAGAVVVADFQTAGRGQYGRTWTARPGSSLLLSVVVDPPTELRRAVVLTAWVAVAVSESVRRLAGIPPRIKWPNDLYLNGKKVCGILTEQGRTVVCGIGLNVNQSAADFAIADLPGATSLAVEANVTFTVRDVTATVVQSLGDVYDRLLSGERAGLEAEWAAWTGLLGRSVVAESTDGSRVEGVVRHLGFDGVLLDSDGAVRALLPEHVRQLRPA